MSIDKATSLIHKELSGFLEKGQELFCSSSFQTHSIPLLHILSTFDKKIPIYFIDTGFHFPETILFRDEISERLNIEVTVLKSPVNKISQLDQNSRFYFASNPDYCCYINKVLPLEPILQSKDIWISGVRADQSKHRSNLKKTAAGKFSTLKYHPMLEWTNKMIAEYRVKYDLPPHPLESQGYLSIGCEPCTEKFSFMSADEQRSGRWAGLQKSECGLHTELVEKEN